MAAAGSSVEAFEDEPCAYRRATYFLNAIRQARAQPAQGSKRLRQSWLALILQQRCQRQKKPSLLGVVLLRSVRRYNLLRRWLIILFANVAHQAMKGHLDPVGEKEPYTG